MKTKLQHMMLVLFVFAMCILAIPANVLASEETGTEIKYSGTSGDLEWSIDTNGHFKLTGIGEFYEFDEYGNSSSYSELPWIEHIEEVYTAEVNVKNITNLNSLFMSFTELESVDFTGTDTSKVTTVEAMFWDCPKLKSLDLSGFDFTNVIDAYGMFEYCDHLNEIRTPRNINVEIESPWSYVQYWVDENDLICETLPLKKNESILLKLGEFPGISSTSGDLEWSIDKYGHFKLTGSGDCVRNEYGQVPWLKYHEEINTAEVTVQNITDMSNLFSSLTKMTEITFNEMETSKVTTVENMFYGCNKLKSLDLSGFDFLNVVEAAGMFDYCNQLIEVRSPKHVKVEIALPLSDTEDWTDEENTIYENLPLNQSESISLVLGRFPGASGECGNLVWVLDNTGTLTISGTGNMEFEESYYYDAPWDDYKEYIRKVIIEQGVTSIEEEAFYFCENIIDVSISNTVTSIGNSAFGFCEKIESIVLPTGLKKIGREAFYGCKSLKEIQIPSKVTEIGQGAFESADNMTGIWVDENNENYSNDSRGVLFDKEKIKLIMAPEGISGNYIVPNTVTSIEDNAFYYCKLNSITIPGNVKRIGITALKGCSIKNITIEDGVESIGDYAFIYCESLEEVKLPDSVTYLGESAFQGCIKLQKVVLSRKLDAIGKNVFSECWELKNISIPNGIKEIGISAFGGCWELEEIAIPISVKEIKNDAFVYCKSLKSIVIPNEVTSLGRCAFGYCEKLENVVIGRSVAAIADQIFYDCPQLREVKFLGNAPSFVDDFGSFYKLTTTCYYPMNNKTWTEEVRQNYGGTITWIGYESECDSFGHNWSEWKVIKAASCTAVGKETRKCMVCSEEESREITKLGHTYEDTLKPAAFDATGSYVSICKNCNDTIRTSISQVSTPTLSYTKTVYTGSAKKPTVTVKDKKGKVLVKGTDYTVTYTSGRKNVGRYAVTVTLKGNYSGTKKVYFTIVPKKTSSLTSIRYQYGNQIRLSWTKVTGATGYRIEYKKPGATKYTFLKNTTNLYYSKGSLTANKTYYFKVTPYVTIGGTKYYSTASAAYRTTSIATVKKGAKLAQVAKPTVAKSGTKVKVSWKNIANETGYQISRSTSSTGTNIVATYATTTGKSKLVTAAKGTKYYYKVRAYRTVNGKKIYGAWSPVRNFTR